MKQHQLQSYFILETYKNVSFKNQVSVHCCMSISILCCFRLNLDFFVVAFLTESKNTENHVHLMNSNI